MDSYLKMNFLDRSGPRMDPSDSIDSAPVMRDLDNTGPATVVVLPALSCDSSMLHDLKETVETKRRMLVGDFWFQRKDYHPQCTPNLTMSEGHAHAIRQQDPQYKPEVSWADRINDVVSFDGAQLLNNFPEDWRLDSLSSDNRILLLAQWMLGPDMEEIEKEENMLFDKWEYMFEACRDTTCCAEEKDKWKELTLFLHDIAQLRMVELFGDVAGNISWSMFAKTIVNRPIMSGRSIDPTRLVDDILLDRNRMR